MKGGLDNAACCLSLPLRPGTQKSMTSLPTGHMGAAPEQGSHPRERTNNINTHHLWRLQMV